MGQVDHVGRREIDALTHGGTLSAAARDRALLLAGITPDAVRWQHFLSRLFLFFGVTLLAAAVVYFIAYNWDAMGRFAKIALLETALIGAAVAAVVFRRDDLRSRAALLAAVLLAGPLLAFVGQTYQTGADTYELFLAWALLVLPWVLLSRWRLAWCAWLVIANTAIALYFAEAWRPLFGSMFEKEGALVHLLFNALFLFAIERFGQGRLEGDGRGAERLAIAAVLFTAGFLYMHFLFQHGDRSAWQLGVAVLAMAAIGYRYRWVALDLAALALWAFAGIVAVVCTLAKLFFEMHAETGAFLLSGLAAIGLSALTASWLRGLARQQRGEA